MRRATLSLQLLSLEAPGLPLAFRICLLHPRRRAGARARTCIPARSAIAAGPRASMRATCGHLMSWPTKCTNLVKSVADCRRHAGRLTVHRHLPKDAPVRENAIAADACVG